MLNFLFTDIQIIYIILLVGIIFIFINLYLFLFYKKQVYKKAYKKFYFKKIYKYVLDTDYLLINNFNYKLGYKNGFSIDHLLFGKKYIYLIFDEYYLGFINGKINDNSWIYYPLNNKSKIIHNKINDIKKEVNNFIELTNLDNNLFKTIILFNNDCILQIDKYNNKELNKDTYLVNLSYVIKLIKNLENSNINDINQEQVIQTCNDLYKIKSKI